MVNIHVMVLAKQGDLYTTKSRQMYSRVLQHKYWYQIFLHQ